MGFPDWRAYSRIEPQVIGHVARVAGYVTGTAMSRRPAANVTYFQSVTVHLERTHSRAMPLIAIKVAPTVLAQNFGNFAGARSRAMLFPRIP